MRNLSEAADRGEFIRIGTPDGMAEVLRSVLRDFHRLHVSYCYWKGSQRVELALTGGRDLDLLIAKGDQHRAEAILLDSGFKRFDSIDSRHHPSILSFLGYDESSGRLIHLHLHFRLIVGERLLKNFRIPWEAELLASTVTHPTFPIRILHATNEALLLAVRSCLELRWTDPVTVLHWKATKDKFELDRIALAARVERTELHQAATKIAGAKMADLFVDAIYGQQALTARRRLRRRVQKHFAAYRTYNSVEAQLRAAGRALCWAFGGVNRRLLHWPRPWSRRAPGGGCVVALVGIDGSGKTTVGAMCRDWLGSEVDTLPIYFGTGAGRPSLLLWPLKLMVPLVSGVIGTKPQGASHGKISSRPPGRIYQMLMTVWATVVAVEKRNKLLAAHRGASRGLVVLADRYPQYEMLGLNDGPLLWRFAGLPAWLRRSESAAYALAAQLPPDLVIKLEVTPETAGRREPHMDPNVIRERITAIQRLAFPGAQVVCVNAELPLAEVVRTVKREIWHLL